VTVYNDDPVAQAQEFEQCGAVWIHVVDLNGAKSGVPENIRIIEDIMRKTQLKVETGGGIRSMETIRQLRDAGVQRVVLGTSLVADKEFATEAISTYKGLLCAGIDAKSGEVAVQGWREGAGVPADQLVAEVSALGFTHLVYTDIARDGMQTGIDAQAYVHMAQVFGNPVIASGGVSNMDDLHNLGAVAASIEGIITGRAVYERTLDVRRALAYCHDVTTKAATGGEGGDSVC
jgi:phosphoribosylformimino-5-aminoimidazole carboxamide ribotide isomerase